jgi:ABC-2 type transport system ATP-binding protein
MATEPIVSVENLVKRYGERVAVDHLSFSVRKGEVFGLLGPNGAGKTTTLSILASLLEANEGVVTLCGHDLKKARRKVKPLIGVVPQDIALYPSLSARDNLRFFGSVYGLRGKALSQRVDETLAAVGLADRAKDAVQNFSGGMKRRVNIAAGLIHRPQVLFLDEPTVGVDPQSRNFIFEYVEQLKRDGMTVIYTTHYMEEAERLCDRIAIVNAGRIIAMDTPHGLIGLLGGGVVRLGLLPEDRSALIVEVKRLPHVKGVSVKDDVLDIEVNDANRALMALLGLCSSAGAPVQSLEVLQPNLESVFLHLTGKRLRD